MLEALSKMHKKDTGMFSFAKQQVEFHPNILLEFLVSSKLGDWLLGSGDLRKKSPATMEPRKMPKPLMTV